MSQDVLLKEFSSISWNNGTFDMCLGSSYWHFYRPMHPRLLNVTPDFPEDRTGFDPQAVLLMQCVFGHTQNRLNKAISPSLHNVNFDSDYLIFSFLLFFPLIILVVWCCFSWLYCVFFIALVSNRSNHCAHTDLPLIFVIFSTLLLCPVEWMQTK